MIIVSFNINSLRARLHQLEAIVDKYQPALIGLQETKVQDSEFPKETIQNLGYKVLFHGQNYKPKGHYGVALLYRLPLEADGTGLPWDEKDPAERQSRMIRASFALEDGSSLKVFNGYFPQGETRDHPKKFPYKEKFYRDLHRSLTDYHQPDEKILIIGDMNVSPKDNDIGIGEDNRKRWLRTGKCSFLPEEREWYEKLMNWGLQDSFRIKYPDTTTDYSWFDYRSKGFDKEPRRGLRIDHILLSEPLVKNFQDAGIDTDIRGMEKPSDHCPVWVEIK